MSSILQEIFNLFFSDAPSDYVINENRTDVKAECSSSTWKTPLKDDLESIGLNSRDLLHLSIVESGENSCNYSQEENDDFCSFIDSCSTILTSANEKKLIVTIVKKKVDKRISVYYPEQFTNYLSSLSILGLLSVINKSVGDDQFIIFEIQNDSFSEFSSEAIKFVPRGYEEETRVDLTLRSDRINKIANLCHCELSTKYTFIPEDFSPIVASDDEALNKLFSKLTLFYSIIFLFDIIELNESHIKYKLNGYRTIAQSVNVDNAQIESYQSYYNIYQWVYDGGNTVDKIGLARNILSLNQSKDTLALSETTFDAIRSGYNVYQKENIKQYIEIRNKISDQLVELQDKADKIVDSFISDYKRSFFAVLSFFITVIVIEVVSNGNYIGAFTIEVTFLSIGFLLISLIFMVFSRWEIKKELVRYEDNYHNLKARYQDLLDSSDINRILNNDNDFNSNKSFIRERRSKYTILWVLSLSILFVIIVTLYFVNNPFPTVCATANFIKRVIICCFTKSMLL